MENIKRDGPVMPVILETFLREGISPDYGNTPANSSAAATAYLTITAFAARIPEFVNFSYGEKTACTVAFSVLSVTVVDGDLRSAIVALRIVAPWPSAS
jgi:hypothetical protein